MVQIQNASSEPAAPTRMQRRSEARRLAILSAAARVFRRRGFAGTGMREIADEADLSPGNLYYYFTGKDEILYFCQDLWLDRMLGALGRVPALAADTYGRLTHVLQTHVRCMLEEFEGGVAHLETDSLPEELRDRLINKRDRYEQGIRELVAAGIASAEFAPCDPALITRAILGALNWSARWYRPDGTQSPDQLAAGLVSYLMRGLRPGKP